MSPATGGLDIFSQKNLDKLDGIPSFCNSPLKKLREKRRAKLLAKQIIKTGGAGKGETAISPKKMLQNKLRKKTEEKRARDLAKRILASGSSDTGEVAFSPKEFLKRQLQENSKVKRAALETMIREEEESKESEDVRKKVAKMRLSHSPKSHSPALDGSKSHSPLSHSPLISIIHGSHSPHTPLSGSPATGSPHAVAG